MAKQLDIFKCELCGNVVELLHVGGGQLVCCGQPMTLMEEQNADSATEKHVPVIEKKDGGLLVKVGSIPHPMIEKHYIEWIQLIIDGKNCRQFQTGRCPGGVLRRGRRRRIGQGILQYPRTLEELKQRHQ